MPPAGEIQSASVIRWRNTGNGLVCTQNDALGNFTALHVAVIHTSDLVPPGAKAATGKYPQWLQPPMQGLQCTVTPKGRNRIAVLRSVLPGVTHITAAVNQACTDAGIDATTHETLL